MGRQAADDAGGKTGRAFSRSLMRGAGHWRVSKDICSSAPTSASRAVRGAAAHRTARVSCKSFSRRRSAAGGWRRGWAPQKARGGCSPDGKGELQKLFKEAIGGAGLKATVRANKAGCLDQCEHGPTVVVYPEAVWYGHVTPEDADEIVTEHLVHGRPVERLVLAEECINTASCPHRVAAPAKS